MAAYGLLTSVGFATARDTMGFLEALLESLGAGLEQCPREYSEPRYSPGHVTKVIQIK